MDYVENNGQPSWTLSPVQIYLSGSDTSELPAARRDDLKNMEQYSYNWLPSYTYNPSVRAELVSKGVGNCLIQGYLSLYMLLVPTRLHSVWNSVESTVNHLCHIDIGITL